MRHPHVVDVLDVGTHAGTPFLVLTLLEGQSLSEPLCILGPLPQTALVDLMVPVLAALSTGKGSPRAIASWARRAAWPRSRPGRRATWAPPPISTPSA